METLIVPAIIATSQQKLSEMLKEIKGTTQRVMLDVMDGKFVPNKSLDFDFTLPKDLPFEYEAHLMIEKPNEWIYKKWDKVDIAILHVETLVDIAHSIHHARKKDLKVTLAINPETPLEVIIPYIGKIDTVLILTVHPGGYSAKFQPQTLNKVRVLRNLDGDLPIEVDGGMNPKNARLAKEAGATIFASGSYIMKNEDPKKAIQELENALK
jgi:ribulose-phosphate 3-epimerase